METEARNNRAPPSRQERIAMMNDVWAVVAVIGLACWLLSALIFIFKAFPGRGQFLARPALTWGTVLIVSYIVWVVGMLRA